jgi:hypothetical protein
MPSALSVLFLSFFRPGCERRRSRRADWLATPNLALGGKPPGPKHPPPQSAAAAVRKKRTFPDGVANRSNRPKIAIPDRRYGHCGQRGYRRIDKAAAGRRFRGSRDSGRKR